MANEIINIENFPESNIAERTILTADALSGQKIVTAENVDGLQSTDIVVVGLPGQENAEISNIDSISGLAVTMLANLALKHYRNEPLTKIRANQAKIYRAANVDGTVPDDADFSVIATIDLQADQLFTEYVTTTGGAGYWFKYTFYNSVSASETPIADAVAMRGGNYGAYATVEEARTEAGLQNNRWILDQTIQSKLTQSQSEVNGSLSIAGYTLPLETVPEMIKNVTLLLTAGYLLTMDYGPEHTGTNKDGQLKLKMARDILTKIETGEMQLLDNTTQTPMAQSTGVRGYPDNTAATNTPSEAPMFSITDRL